MPRAKIRAAIEVGGGVVIRGLILGSILGLVLGLGQLLGCYNPKVTSGGLLCDVVGTKPCPDGFACAGDGVCVAFPATGTGGNRSPGTGGAASGGVTGSGGAVGGSSQDGGGSGQAGGGGEQAGGIGGSSPPRQRGDTCLVSRDPGGAQTDDCDGGLVCVADCGGSVTRCHSVCQTDDDCPDSSCTSRPSTAQKICDVPFSTCNPLDGQTGCLASTDGCYLLSDALTSAGGDRSVCDCPIGAGSVGDPCSDSRACARGLLCPPPGGAMGGGSCQRICDPQLGDAACQVGTCHPYGARWGFCF